MEYNLITFAAIILALNVAQSEANLWDDITDKIVSIFELKISEKWNDKTNRILFHRTK